MITFAQYPLDEILPYIGNHRKTVLNTAFGPFRVKTSTNRLRCLKRNQNCVNCNKIGSLWLLQIHQEVHHNKTACFIENCEWCAITPPERKSSPHLNLYAVGAKGGLTLMTQDHIMPRCMGGSNNLNNLITMCFNCNRKKGSLTPEEWEKSRYNILNRMKRKTNEYQL